MPSQWNGDADRDLLLAIIEDGSTKSINWPNVASTIQGKGYSFSHEACRQHFQKIRRNANASAIGSTVGPATSGNNSYASSPNVKRKVATPRKPAAPKNAAASRTPTPDLTPPKEITLYHSDDDENDLPPRPTAKRQRVIKNEDTGFGGIDENRMYKFKTEQLGGPEHPEHGAIDLERDENLYDDDI
ncbi:hypothetical protein VTL71DRAFT_2745 [Oculimacula yallundae]|uniref:Myb-like domain-containing protein n=1 Tax=Oculimacula yallundae TaxID=86028 RepID=A0ABR4C9R1_9HELO